jgi:hypothetical protein
VGSRTVEHAEPERLRDVDDGIGGAGEARVQEGQLRAATTGAAAA